MKSIAIIAMLTATAGAAEARGFQPWGNVTNPSNAPAAQSETTAPSGAFYSGGLPTVVDTSEATRAAVVVKSWYFDDRV